MKYEDYVYPLWGEVLGWLITAVSMLLVPVLIVKTVVDIYCRGKGGTDPAEVRESFEHCLKSFVSRFVLLIPLSKRCFIFSLSPQTILSHETATTSHVLSRE